MVKKITCIIPARYKSSRFPGKPLHLIAGKPMILWVIENANKSKYINEAIVATDDERIFKVVTDAGFKAQYTSEGCPDGSTRVAEVAAKLDDEWIFEMQGDQPMVTPEIIDNFLLEAIAETEKNKSVQVVIPYAKVTEEDTESEDVLKVVVTESERLVFQTRHPVKTGFRTLGLYLWERKALMHFSELPVSDLEKIESSHPIRLYVNDFYVQGVEVKGRFWVEVDRIEQVSAVENFFLPS